MSNYEGNKSKNSLWKDILAIFLATGAAILYRMGGSGNYARFFRPLGIGFATTIILCLINLHWSAILAGGASAGLSTTYFKKKGSEAKWFNWLFVGLAMSLAVIPWCLFNGHWIGFGIRTFVLTGLIILWCQSIGDAVLEELGRGFLIISTLLLLFIA